MKIGRLSENIWKRSVSKAVSDAVFDKNGIGIGNDVFVSQSTGGCCVSEAVTIPYCRQMGAIAVHLAVMNLRTVCDNPCAVNISFLLDGRTGEEFLTHVAGDVARAAKAEKVCVGGFDVHVVQGLKKPLISCSAYGSNGIPAGRMKVDEDIVVTGYVGLAGSVMITDAKETELKNYYPADYIDTIYDFEKMLMTAEAVEAVKDLNPSYIRGIHEGGIMRTLSEATERSRTGLTVNLKEIPLKQETVEICNYLDLNPYILISGGSMMFSVKDGASAVNALSEKGIRACVIGHTNSTNDKILVNDDEITYITLPSQDAIYGL